MTKQNENVKRHTGILYIDAVMSNPNGDPDDENRPRTINGTRGSIGVITDVCIKRKIRDFIIKTKHGEAGFDIAVRQENDFDTVVAANTVSELTENYFDYRVFGVVIPKGAKKDTEKKKNKSGKDINEPDRIKGPVQFGYASSIDPVNIVDMTITRISASGGKKQTMGNKKVVQYGMYKFVFNIDAYEGAKTKMTQEDVKTLTDALIYCWELDKSSVRSDIAPRGLFMFEHENALGCNARHLHNLVSVVKSADEPQKPEDYVLSIDESKIPEGVKLVVNKIF